MLKVLNAFLSLSKNFKAMRKRHPFGSVDESFEGSIASSFVINDAHINVDVVQSKGTVFRQTFRIEIIWVDRSVWFYALRSGYTWVKMVFTFQSLVAFYCLFELKLNLRKVGAKFERNFINELWCQSKVRPSRQILMSLVLEFELSPLIKLAHLLPNVVWSGLVPQVFPHQLLQVIGH